MGKNYDFKGFAQDLLNQGSSLVRQWLPDGKMEGKEWVATNPTRGDSSPGSFKVCTRTGKWSDFAVGESGGDLISLYAYLRGLKMSEAYAELNGPGQKELRYTKNKDNDKPREFEESFTQIEVPADAPEMPAPRGRRAEAQYKDPETGEELYPYTVYRDFEGQPVYRVVTTRNKKTGNKYPIPCSWGRYIREQERWDDNLKQYIKTGKILDDIGWHQKDWKERVPLCGVDYLFKRPEAIVVVVEGEKAWASLIERLPEYTAITWRGGTNRVGDADWSQITNRRVIVCPDYDEPGQKAGLKIADILKRQKNDVKICWEPLKAGIHEPGWDLADEENVDKVREYLKSEPVLLSSVEAYLQQEAENDADVAEVSSYYQDLLTSNAGKILEEQKELRCLGYGGENKCYFISRKRGIVVALSANQLASLDYLLALMPLTFWYDLFPNPKGGFNKHDCADTLQRWADVKGYFNPDIIRGAGVWVEKNGAHVLHMGQELLVDKELHSINEFESEYMYEATANLGVAAIKPLGNSSSKKLLDICEGLDWEVPVYGKLLAGFAAIAPMCGGLNWRPHIWITGTAGSGKTTVISKILHRACGKMSLFVQGDSSAAGIRQRLGSDALPVIFDEFEGENAKRLDELQKTLDLARQASSESGALMLKGSGTGEAVEFKVRSCFAFSSINVNIQHYADASRITVLTLKDPKLKLLSAEEKQERIEQYTIFERGLRETLTDEYINALQIRTFGLLPVIKENARIFAEAAQKHLGSARIGDQLGILCAAAYCLEHQDLIDPAEAEDWVKKQDWTDSTPSSDVKDHDECLSRMVQYILRPQEEGHYVERAVGEMIATVFEDRTHATEYDNVLKRYGFKVNKEEEVVWIANIHTKLKEIMSNSAYQSWSRLLLRCEGAKPSNGSIRFTQGTRARAVGIPKEVILAGVADKPDAEF